MMEMTFRRLGYARYLLHLGFWRWTMRRLDFLVQDHVKAWTVLRRAPGSTVHPSVSFRSPHNVEIGAHTRIQQGCVLWASPASRIVVGRYSGLGPGTMIYSSNHQYQPGVPYHQQPWVERDVIIGEDVWVGGGSIILPGVSIGDGCVVAAGSVVTKDLPAGCVAAGVPAKVIKAREPVAAAPSLPSADAAGATTRTAP